MWKTIQMLEEAGIEVLRTEWIEDTLDIDTSDNERAMELMIEDGFFEEEPA
jgi:hypothetical protein